MNSAVSVKKVLALKGSGWIFTAILLHCLREVDSSASPLNVTPVFMAASDCRQYTQCAALTDLAIFVFFIIWF